MKFSSTFVIISSSTLAAAFAPIGGEILYMIDLFFAVLMHYLEEEAAGGGHGERVFCNTWVLWGFLSYSAMRK